MSALVPGSSGWNPGFGAVGFPLRDLKHSVLPSFLSCYGGLGRSGLSKNLSSELLSSAGTLPLTFSAPQSPPA